MQRLVRPASRRPKRRELISLTIVASLFITSASADTYPERRRGNWSGNHVSLPTISEDSDTRHLEARIASSGGRGFIRLAAAEIPAPPPASGNYVWWEAEDANSRSPTGDGNDAALSNGRWLWVNNVTEGQPRFLQHDVISVPEDGTYQFFVRKFWKHGPFRWRFDNQPWQEVTSDVALLDSQPAVGNVVNWMHGGEATLTAGDHLFRVELLEASGAAAMDAFVITQDPFIPRGKLKPKDKYNVTEPGWFAFEPGIDPFRYSPIDLRALNEPRAGSKGFIQASGENFIHADTGDTVRFWAVNAGPDIARLDSGSMNYLARFLAKLGVNMVRYHGPFYTPSGANFGAVDTEQLDNIFRLVAALKREGIYTSLSIYFPLWVNLGGPAGYPGYDSLSNKRPFALLYFDPAFQSKYRGWWQALLTTINPHTGLRLKDDPAVAIAELVNEDSYLFWTFNPNANPSNIPNVHLLALEKLFGEWLIDRHGSLNNTLKAWGGLSHSRDDFANGRAGFRDLWAIFNNKTSRDQETAEFLAWHQKKFYDDTAEWLRDTIGFQAMIAGSNWKTASPQILDPLDKYSNAGLDFLDRHGYFGSKHTGSTASYQIADGHQYDDRAAVKFEPVSPGDPLSFDLPIMDIIHDGKPSTISEINWPMPNRYRADMPLLCAAYGALQGTDAFFHFALNAATWQQVHTKFPIQTPVTFSQFPASAILYRLGYVREAEAIASYDLNVDDLFDLKGAPVSAPQNFDDLRNDDIPPGGTVTHLNSLDPLAFLVGKVKMNFTTGSASESVTELSRFIDRDARTVASETGELNWDHQKGLVTANTPKARAAAGFLSDAGAIKLGDITIHSAIHHGAVMLVSLDEQPLNESRRMLLQVMSEDKNFGWQTSPVTGLRTIDNVGGPPLMVKDFSGSVTFTRPDAESLKTTHLDLNGYETEARSTGATVDLAPDTIYYLITVEE